MLVTRAEEVRNLVLNDLVGRQQVPAVKFDIGGRLNNG